MDEDDIEEFFTDISSEYRYAMDDDMYKISGYDWDFTLYSSDNESIDSIDAEYWPDLDWVKRTHKYTSTPKLERITKKDLDNLQLA